jgi:hypothetical protein
MASTLEIVFGVGTGVSGLVVLLFMAWGTFMWMFRRAENPSHIVVWAATVYTLVYAALLTDATSTLRTGDGVEYPWIRSAGNAVVYLLLAWMSAEALWLEAADVYFNVGAALLGALAFVGADVFATPRSWWWWSAGLVAQLAQVALLLRRSRRHGSRAWLLFFASLVWSLGMPIVQALSWTLGAALDSPPHRQTSEIIFLIVSMLGIGGYGALAMLLWRQLPHDYVPANAAQTRMTPPAENSATLVAAPIAMATSLRHRPHRS